MRLPLPFSRSLRPFWPAPGLLLVGKARYSLRPSSLSKTLIDTQEDTGREVSPFAPFPRPQILSIEPRSHPQVREKQVRPNPVFKICLPVEPEGAWVEGHSV